MASKEQMDAWLEAGKGGYTSEELAKAFDLVKNEEHWKYDIDAIVPEYMRDVLIYAIPWYVGGGDIEFIDKNDGTIRVIATGYWSNGMDG